MKLTETLDSLVLEGNYDAASTTSNLFWLLMGISVFVFTFFIDKNRVPLYFMAAALGGLGLIFLLLERKDVLTIDKKDSSIKLYSMGIFGLFDKTITKPAKVTQLHTRIEPRGISVPSDTKAYFIFTFWDKSTLVFCANRIKIIERDKQPFFSVPKTSKRGFEKTMEQDVYAPKIAKFLKTHLVTEMPAKLSKNLIAEQRFRDV